MRARRSIGRLSPRQGVVRKWAPSRAARQVLILAFLALASASCGGAPEVDLSSHNLLLITIDTLRADRLGSYGYEDGATPHLDRLAQNGVRFENVYSPVPLTLPTHSVLFTGRNPLATGVRINGVHYLDEAAVTLAERFKDGGFDTAAFVAAYVLISRFGLDQGFDEYEDSLAIDDLFRFTSELRADEVYRRFAGWLERRGEANDGKRFFAWLHFYDPHLPYDPPAPYAGEFPRSPYDGEIAFVDATVGRILDDLETAGLLDSTAVVVTSDHGEAFGEHVEQGHGLLTYDETLRVPLILHAPTALPRGLTVSEPAGLVDLMPTLLGLFGLEPAATDGKDLRPLLDGAQRPGPGLYFESLAGVDEKSWAPRTGIVARGHKYIDVPRPELYDLEADPLERRNLLATPDRSAAEMREDLEGRLADLVAGGRADAAPSRELDAEDRRHLAALGYLGSSAGGASVVLDPRRGIEIEMRTREARTLVRNGEVDRAASVLALLRADNPDVEIADFYELEHEIRAARGDVPGATAALQKGAAVFPEGALVLRLASYHFENDDLAAAEELARTILERDPRMSQAVNLLGMIAAKGGDPGQALAHFERALKLEPTSIPLQLRIADLQSQLGRIPEALAIYERLLKSGALDASADHLFKAATLNAMTGRLPRAEELFRRGLVLAPAGRHYLALAMIQMQAQKPDEASRTLEEALTGFREGLEPREIQLAEALLQQVRAAR